MLKKFLKSLKDDLLNKKYLPIKIVFFLIYGGISTIVPFLTVHARSLGITGTELGIIYAILPLTGLLGPSVSGLIADKLGNFRILVSLALLFGGLTGLLFIAIPAGRTEQKLPKQLPVTVECSANSSGTVQPQLSCTLKEKLSESFINISKCCVNCSDIDTDFNILHKNIQRWCENTADCEIEDYSGVVFTDSMHHKMVGKRSEKNGTHYLFNNFSMPISINKDKKNININGTFCPERKPAGEMFSDSSKDNLKEDNFTSSGIPHKCILKCQAFAKSSEICSNENYLVDKNPVVTMVAYTAVRFINALILGSALTLFETAVIAIIQEDNGNLGFQRMYSNLGQIVLTPISGKLIDYTTVLKGSPDYNPAFYLSCAIQILCCLFFLKIKLDFKPPSDSVLKDFKDLIIQPVIVVILLFALVVGSCFGFVETFLFWLLEDLGADTSLMGLTVTVGGLFGIPLLMISDAILEKLGYVNTLALCCIVYVARFVGYSYITNAWAVLPFEALEGFTTSLFIVALTKYAASLSSPTTVASLQGILFGTYYSVGKGLGSLIGGIMLEKLGDRMTYQIIAAVAGVASVVYVLIDRLVFRKRKQTQVTAFEKVDDPEGASDINLNTFSNSKRNSHNNNNNKRNSHNNNNKINSHNNNNNKSKVKGIDNLAFADVE